MDDDLDLIAALLDGRLDVLTVPPDGPARPEPTPGRALLSGSFNPLHDGHTGLLVAGSAHAGRPLAFELTVHNADKGLLTAVEVGRRIAQFRGRHPVVITREPLFTAKAALLPESLFVVGYDTADRLVRPRYYSDDARAMHAALAAIRDRGGRFLVAGRRVEGRYRTLADVPVPVEFADLFEPLPESAFRLDLSSTELRAKAPSELPCADRGAPPPAGR